MTGVMVVSADAADLPVLMELEQMVAEAPHWTEAEYWAIVEGSGVVRRCLLVAKRENELIGFAVGEVVALLQQAVLHNWGLKYSLSTKTVLALAKHTEMNAFIRCSQRQFTVGRSRATPFIGFIHTQLTVVVSSHPGMFWI